MKLPTLFLSHGSPMFAVEPGLLGPLLGRLGHALPRPRAVLVLSPHWMGRRLEVTGAAAPDTVHDFGGFPRMLYELRYPAPGAPEVAAEVVAQLAHHRLQATVNPHNGLDHGAWVPLRYLYPGADVPVVQITQPSSPSPLALLELGQALAPLRERGILIVASGSMTHNLYEFRSAGGGDPYAQAFADWVWQRIGDGDLGALLDYRSQAPSAVRAHPTDEHFLPLYFAIGAAGEDWRSATRLEGGITYGVLSMDSFVFGVRLALEAVPQPVPA
ncbi:DODA-type extradiol aromatic ring-opening family dioxygenase [Thauera sinica]|uniref:DODA-type extradiol aromatic ring-opening family dioxygenase n=1 Tax=Thauera sinica TaxID=2665146 RepID=A0ABW1AS60_9RHOO|nr:class III extradiol ring-cleavage dioxygenase [Thauera sp. K11]ATE61125.1 dioxygenase [Thauera sp. K11]